MSVVTIAREGNIAVVSIDHPPVNALSKSVREGLLRAIADVENDAGVIAAVISGGKGRFIAGADIREMALPPEAPFLSDVVAALESCSKPIVAAIDGPALGGGLEIALACDKRIMSETAKLGLTETRLGIVPGAGGTQRLPRLTGVSAAMSLIGDARIVGAEEARKLGIIDSIVSGAHAREAMLRAAQTANKAPVSMRAVPCEDEGAVEATEVRILARAKAAPAVAQALRLVKASATTPFEQGLKSERASFLKLRESAEAKALRHVFFAERDVWKVPGLEPSGDRVRRAAVIGAGTMGVGIAMALADNGIDVAVIERDAEAARAGEGRAAQAFDRMVTAGKIGKDEAAARRSRLSFGSDWSSVTAADVVIEAAFEDIGVKTDIFRRLDSVASPSALLATNTSYLDIDTIAEEVSNSGRVVGLHFFSPANVMKLLEIVRGGRTSDAALARALGLAKQLAKVPVVARNCDGFIGNRMYAVYRRHAEYLVEDGASPAEVDAALEAYGFAMGIFAVSDLSGLDIAYAMRKRRAASRSPAERYVTIADTLCEAGRLGKKTKGGWYSYDESGRRQSSEEVSAVIEAARQATARTPTEFSPRQIQRRLLAVLANEGAKVLADGTALRASDIDVAFVNGYGFPRAKGGPMWSADEIGLSEILEEVQAAHLAGGAGSEPADLLVHLAASGGKFSTWYR